MHTLVIKGQRVIRLIKHKHEAFVNFVHSLRHTSECASKGGTTGIIRNRFGTDRKSLITCSRNVFPSNPTITKSANAAPTVYNSQRKNRNANINKMITPIPDSCFIRMKVFEFTV
jgi:hypothetical protein